VAGIDRSSGTNFSLKSYKLSRNSKADNALILAKMLKDKMNILLLAATSIITGLVIWLNANHDPNVVSLFDFFMPF